MLAEEDDDRVDIAKKKNRRNMLKETRVKSVKIKIKMGE